MKKKAIVLLSALLVLITFISCDIVYSSTISGSVKINKAENISVTKVDVYAYMDKSERDRDLNNDGNPALYDDWTSASNSGSQFPGSQNDESAYTFSLNNFMWKESGSEFGDVGARGECYLLVLVEYKDGEESKTKKVDAVAPLVSDASRTVTITVDLL
ncbi:MAG TPA: hypothetical protein IAB12_00640 [Candidatus Ornithospirochaeta avicola]|uniref:Uncharacterized protein n=1 Tax=Candidatus Ornithospirochaeta avicola TaxID=2840896 RepID=A0A9D1PS89_9SPIO|nr:hypothetical protein [Candidatus Ornithospirochaeta avicola]